MEYVQMTMLELEERESSIKTKLGSIVENFLLVGKDKFFICIRGFF